MTIQDVIDDANAGELSQVSATEQDILSYINLGLIELYKRFSLRWEEAIVTMRQDKTVYKLDGTDSNVEISSDINTIAEVYDENGASLPINSETEALSINTPTWNTIQVPYPSEGDKLSVIYTAPPERVTDPTDKLTIPSTLLEALLHYVGYRAHGSINGNIDGENNTHYVRFEKSCDDVTKRGLVTTDDMTNHDIKDKGFV